MQTSVIHKKHFFYPPGFISLLLLTPLCLLYFYQHNAFDRPRVLEINWWSESWGKFCVEENSYSIRPERKFMDIQITDNDDDNKIKLEYSRLAIRELIASKDTIKGIHFYFEDASNYWSLVRAIDICFTEKATTFVPKDNDLWVFNYTPKPIPEECFPPPMMCGTGMMRYFGSMENELEIAEEKQKKIVYLTGLVKQYWLPELLFILMLILTIKKLRFA